MRKLSLALALILAAPALAAPANSPPRIDIALSNFDFAPSTLRLVAGQPVQLHLTNRSRGGHSFTAREFFSRARFVSGASAVRNGEVNLRGHQQVDIVLVPAAGDYPLKCTHSFHKMLGMKGRIIVS